MVTFLESMITSGVYAPGNKLPAQRDLCGKFALTKGTVGRGLALLERRGLIEQRRGAGAFVRQVSTKIDRKALQIGVLIEEYDGDRTYCGHILRGVQMLAAEKNCALHLNFTAYTDFDFSEMQNYAAKLDGVLLIGVYDTTAPQLPKTRPCVGVNMYRAYGYASIVDLDPIAAAELTVEHFVKCGVKRLVCFTINPQGAPKCSGINSTFKFRAQMVKASWPGDCVIVECDEDHEERPEEWIDGETGLVFVSGSRFEVAARAYRKRNGRALTDDARVLSIDGKSLLVPEYLPVDTVATDYTAMGKLALDECLRRINNPGSGPRRIYQNVYLTRKDLRDNGIMNAPE
jgi:DNA-binding LacI/PurR family transcriptional regulator